MKIVLAVENHTMSDETTENCGKDTPAEQLTLEENQRRYKLIKRSVRGELMDCEKLELKGLQDRERAWMKENFPSTFTPEGREVIRKLEERYRASIDTGTEPTTG